VNIVITTPIKEALHEDKRKSTSVHNQSKAIEQEKVEIIEESDDEADIDKDSEFDDKAKNTPRDMFIIYYPTPDEIIINLCSYVYDPVLNQINKETKKNIIKDDGTEDMQVDKNVVILNTSGDAVANANLGTTINKVIEENVFTLTNQVKDLQKRVIQLEQENT